MRALSKVKDIFCVLLLFLSVLIMFMQVEKNKCFHIVWLYEQSTCWPKGGYLFRWLFLEDLEKINKNRPQEEVKPDRNVNKNRFVVTNLLKILQHPNLFTHVILLWLPWTIYKDYFQGPWLCAIRKVGKWVFMEVKSWYYSSVEFLIRYLWDHVQDKKIRGRCWVSTIFLHFQTIKFCLLHWFST